MFVEDISQWEGLDPIDADTAAMAFIANEVIKYTELHEDAPDDFPCLTIEGWENVLGEELSFQRSQSDDYWHIASDADFDAMAGRIDAYLPYFLENYRPAYVLTEW